MRIHTHTEKKISRGSINTWKDARLHWSSGKHTLRWQWVTNYPTSTITAKIIKTDICKSLQGSGSGTSFKLAQTLRKAVWQNLLKLTYSSATTQQFYCWLFTQQKWVLGSAGDVYIAASFVIAKAWEPPNCPSTSRQDKLWHIHTMEYKTAMKKKHTKKTQNTMTHKNMAKYHRHYGEQNKEDPNKYVL